jgi:glycosyltransferase involved in cell wall biosynthesis
MSPPITISVVMPCFNRLRHLRSAVDSVCVQTWTDFEFLIIDDGSDAETRAYLAGLVDPRIRVILHAHTGNQSRLRNLGVAQARGRYVAFMDSDDVWVRERLALHLPLLRAHPTRRWSYCNCSMIDVDGNPLPIEHFAPWRPIDGAIIEPLLTFDASVSTAAVIAERTLLEEAGGFDERLRFCQSYDLWFRLALRSEISVCAEPLVLVRTHEECFTRDLVGTAAGWVAVFAKMAGSLEPSRLRRLSRRRFRDSALALARLYARQHRWAEMFATLGTAQRLGPAAPRWWLRASRMLGGALLARRP